MAETRPKRRGNMSTHSLRIDLSRPFTSSFAESSVLLHLWEWHVAGFGLVRLHSLFSRSRAESNCCAEDRPRIRPSVRSNLESAAAAVPLAFPRGRGLRSHSLFPSHRCIPFHSMQGLLSYLCIVTNGQCTLHISPFAVAIFTILMATSSGSDSSESNEVVRAEAVATAGTI